VRQKLAGGYLLGPRLGSHGPDAMHGIESTGGPGSPSQLMTGRYPLAFDRSGVRMNRQQREGRPCAGTFGGAEAGGHS
jgi:hypothetical protein